RRGNSFWSVFIVLCLMPVLFPMCLRFVTQFLLASLLCALTIACRVYSPEQIRRVMKPNDRGVTVLCVAEQAGVFMLPVADIGRYQVHGWVSREMTENFLLHR